MLQSHEEYAKYAKESADEFKDVLNQAVAGLGDDRHRRQAREAGGLQGQGRRDGLLVPRLRLVHVRDAAGEAARRRLQGQGASSCSA